MDSRAGIFLCGDVMTGRAIDQILPYPGDPALFEPYIKDARRYIWYAWRKSGYIHNKVPFDYIWGDALKYMSRANCRIVNLETSITSKGSPAIKRIHYRMNPKNINSILAANIDCCVLANNHVLDWGEEGLEETLKVLDEASQAYAGAGVNQTRASEPCIIEIKGKGRILVFAMGHASSKIPEGWAASDTGPGINMLPDLGEHTVLKLKEHIENFRRDGDLVVVSIHWGDNWGYEIPRSRREFAHALVDVAGVDLLHGHSSHHFQGIEVYKSKLILYGCGDFINDYEGIRNHREYRAHLGLMYFPAYDFESSALTNLYLIPTQIRKFRVRLANSRNKKWILEVLNREGAAFNTSVAAFDEVRLQVRWR